MDSTLKSEILKLLDTDEEFRYMVAGYLGYKELFEEIKRLREDFNKMLTRIENLEIGQKNLEAALLKLREDMNRGFREIIDLIHREISKLGSRWGIATEDAFRAGLKGIIKELEVGYKTEKWNYNDTKGSVYGYPSSVEVDVLIKDAEHILIEVKESVSTGDVSELSRIAKLYEEVNRIKPKNVAIISPYVRANALELAKKLNIELYID